MPPPKAITTEMDIRMRARKWTSECEHGNGHPNASASHGHAHERSNPQHSARPLGASTKSHTVTIGWRTHAANTRTHGCRWCRRWSMPDVPSCPCRLFPPAYTCPSPARGASAHASRHDARSTKHEARSTKHEARSTKHEARLHKYAGTKCTRKTNTCGTGRTPQQAARAVGASNKLCSRALAGVGGDRKSVV